MRRKPGTLLPIECSIIEAAANLQRQGVGEFHGFQIAKEIKDQKGARLLTGYGTLYRALARLQQRGILQSRWEEPLPSEENRPRRRYYTLIGETEAPVVSNPAPTRAHMACKLLGRGVAQP